MGLSQLFWDVLLSSNLKWANIFLETFYFQIGVFAGSNKKVLRWQKKFCITKICKPLESSRNLCGVKPSSNLEPCSLVEVQEQKGSSKGLLPRESSCTDKLWIIMFGGLFLCCNNAINLYFSLSGATFVRKMCLWLSSRVEYLGCTHEKLH